jgi:hypothetical protein
MKKNEIPIGVLVAVGAPSDLLNKTARQGIPLKIGGVERDWKESFARKPKIWADSNAPKNNILIRLNVGDEWFETVVKSSQLLCTWEEYEKKEADTESKDEFSKRLRQLRYYFQSFANQLSKHGIETRVYTPVCDVPRGLILEKDALEKLISLLK